MAAAVHADNLGASKINQRTPVTANIHASNKKPGGVKNNSLTAKASASLPTPLIHQYSSDVHIERSSFFVPTPTSIAEAHSDANDVVVKLKQFSQAGNKPLVFIEPDNSTGNIDLQAYANGSFDPALDAYFSAIKSAGVTDQMMGLWIFMPEGNLPVWSSVDPSIYSNIVVRTINLQKKYFPASLSGLLLDNQTYPSASSWSNGQSVSLLPYIQNIPKGLVDYFGLQGFPWAAPANQGGEKSFNPALYLKPELATEAANLLGTSKIWFNTGSFSRKYTQSATQTVSVSPAERQAMLDGVISQAKVIKNQGFDMSVHLFTEDKSKADEATDWSYRSDSTSNNVFMNFAGQLGDSGIPLWLYDPR